MDDKKKIQDCYREMYQAMTDKNRRGLEKVLHDSFCLVHMTGMRQSKREFIYSISNGTLNYYSAVHQSMDVTLNGDKAVLDGKSIVSAAVFGGNRHTWRLRQRISLVKENDRWQMTESVASTY